MPRTVFNVTEKDHRSKEAFYSEAAKKSGLTLPPFLPSAHQKQSSIFQKKLNRI